MNFDLNPEQLKKLLPLLKKLNRFSGMIAFVAGAAIIGYTGYTVSQAVQVSPDQTTIAAAKSDNKTRIKLDAKTIAYFNQLVQVNPTVDLSNVGKADPFR